MEEEGKIEVKVIKAGKGICRVECRERGKIKLEG